MASRRSDVRPSCRKKIRWPSPHRGAVRNSSPFAFPWVMLSASLGPMLCSNKSENRLARFPLSAGLATFPVGRDGVWHNAQPISLNNLLLDGRRRVGGGGWGSQETHEERKLHRIAGDVRRLGRLEISVIFRGCVEQTPCGLIPFLREQLVGYALLHVIGFA